MSVPTQLAPRFGGVALLERKLPFILCICYFKLSVMIFDCVCCPVAPLKPFPSDKILRVENLSISKTKTIQSNCFQIIQCGS